MPFSQQMHAQRSCNLIYILFGLLTIRVQGKTRHNYRWTINAFLSRFAEVGDQLTSHQFCFSSLFFHIIISRNKFDQHNEDGTPPTEYLSAFVSITDLNEESSHEKRGSVQLSILGLNDERLHSCREHWNTSK